MSPLSQDENDLRAHLLEAAPISLVPLVGGITMAASFFLLNQPQCNGLAKSVRDLS